MDCENTKWNSVRGKGLLCQHCGEPAADQIKGKTIFFYFLHSIDIRYFTCLDVTSYATKKNDRRVHHATSILDVSLTNLEYARQYVVLS
jgi:hypothetical protein